MFFRQKRSPKPPVFHDYQSAAAACPISYSNDMVSGLYVSRTRAVLANEAHHLTLGQGEHVYFGVLYAARKLERPCHILDFGGAAGLHAGLAARTLPDVPQRWAIYDLPATVKAAREVETETVRFFDDLDTAARWLSPVDLVHVSGVIEYLPDVLAAIDKLTALRASTILIQRTYLSEGEKVVFVNEQPLANFGPGPAPDGIPDIKVRFPVTALPAAQFEAQFAGAGYRLVCKVPGNSVEKIGRQKVRHGTVLLFALERE
jgi:putative methyltransferase (TIGR04325 family)